MHVATDTESTPIKIKKKSVLFLNRALGNYPNHCSMRKPCLHHFISLGSRWEWSPALSGEGNLLFQWRKDQKKKKIIALKDLCSWVARVHSQGSPHMKRILRRSLSDLPPKQSPRITRTVCSGAASTLSAGRTWALCTQPMGDGGCPEGWCGLRRVQQAWEHLSTPPWGPDGVFCGKATETLLTLRSKLSGRGPCSSKMPQNMKLVMRFGHSVWSKMGNYGTTYPQMGKKKNEYTRKGNITTKRDGPQKSYLHWVRMPVKAFLKFSLASSISCSWVAFSFISRRTWLLADCTME